MKKLTTLLAVAALATGVATAASAADWGKGSSVRIATEGAYAPWNYTDSSGNLVGFEVDLYKDLCARLELECTLQQQAWEGIIPALQAGKYDAIMAGMSITEKRMEVITFSRSYAATPGVFVVKSDGPFADLKTDVDAVTMSELDDAEKAAIATVKEAFAGKTIGVQIATTHENFLNEFIAGDVTVKTYDTQENLDLDLQAGRVDAALAAMSYWKPLLEKDEGKGLKIVGPGFTGGPFGNGVGAGIRKEDQALADMFSKAIGEAIADGTLSKLAIEHFGFDASAKE
ncbi:MULTISPECIES: transporter substrate-binding domain-containing protein [Thalassobaculum]|uniref:Amino acid ABC transporter substrate-binding protein, PAAT family (TC 3.A.1.3.-) n=1 Tax=Thalassobaculum litoreum DSM 18839 TaxID=1123362 RepID=A0A8G2EY84_9PROT|nr:MULTISPECIES: transporter substrate-binding domain-containing protein [Thalassobaculum]SDF52624.1 amino acid ABC transporter substrate-binding protein, PAAT family (TC 3.A.1.3.-) [Thalassobaculum litoreum DSM 18839]